MPVTFSPIITDLGQSVFVPLATGIEFTFTHVAVGTGTSAVNSTATALENEIARFPIAGGGINSGGKSASINALITNHTNANPQNYNISEIGFFGLDASSNTVLFAIYRQGTTIINKVSGVDIAIPFSLGLGALPASNIIVQLDTNISAMMALLGQHTSLNHPHTQYKRTLNNTERLKLADGVDNDEAASIGQLNAEATARANGDVALSDALAAEITNRESKTNNTSETNIGISRVATLVELFEGQLDNVIVTPKKIRDALDYIESATQISFRLSNGLTIKAGRRHIGDLIEQTTGVDPEYVDEFDVGFSRILFSFIFPYSLGGTGKNRFFMQKRAHSNSSVTVVATEIESVVQNCGFDWLAIGF